MTKDQVAAMLQNSHVMDAGSISRSQLFVDAALCRFWMSRWGEAGPLWMWADSSPQAGTDWLLSVVQFIAEADVVECVQAVKLLRTTTEEFKELEDLSDEVVDRQIAVTRMRHEAGVKLSKKVVQLLSTTSSCVFVTFWRGPLSLKLL